MTPNRLARWALALCAAALAAASFAPAASAAKKKQKDQDPTLKVMTRNIYLGGNIFLPIGAPDRAAFESKTRSCGTRSGSPTSRPAPSCWPTRSRRRKPGPDRAAGGGHLAPQPRPGQGRLGHPVDSRWSTTS